MIYVHIPSLQRHKSHRDRHLPNGRSFFCIKKNAHSKLHKKAKKKLSFFYAQKSKKKIILPFYIIGGG